MGGSLMATVRGVAKLDATTKQQTTRLKRKPKIIQNQF